MHTASSKPKQATGALSRESAWTNSGFVAQRRSLRSRTGGQNPARSTFGDTVLCPSPVSRLLLTSSSASLSAVSPAPARRAQTTPIFRPPPAPFRPPAPTSSHPPPPNVALSSAPSNPPPPL